MIVDVTTATMHAPIEDNVKVKAPPGITSTTGYWQCLKALSGTRMASQSWTGFAAERMAARGAQRSAHNPAIFFDTEADYTTEQHGDDFMSEGPRDEIVLLEEWLRANFKVKKADIISTHPAGKKE